MKEQANGATHGRRDHPVVLAGSCGGVFRLGRALDVGGKPHSGLLIALASAMDGRAHARVDVGGGATRAALPATRFHRTMSPAAWVTRSRGAPGRPP